MILGLFHPGSGLGDNLFCYLAARITAQRLGVKFTMVGQFKGDFFLKLDKGISFSYPTDVPHHIEMPAGKIVIDYENYPIYEGKSYYDPEFNFIENETIVDGCRCQDERYWEKYPVDEWLKTEKVEVPDDLCIIGFRGGEYYAIPELGLTKDYFVDAMALMRKENPNMRFRVVTDDPDMARTCFPHLEITHELSMDWRQVRYARYAIIANSAFYILPRWLRHQETQKGSMKDSFTRDAVTIAPRRWARRNVMGEWSTPQSYYPAFRYI